MGNSVVGNAERALVIFRKKRAVRQDNPAAEFLCGRGPALDDMVNNVGSDLEDHGYEYDFKDPKPGYWVLDTVPVHSWSGGYEYPEEYDGADFFEKGKFRRPTDQEMALILREDWKGLTRTWRDIQSAFDHQMVGLRSTGESIKWSVFLSQVGSLKEISNVEMRAMLHSHEIQPFDQPALDREKLELIAMTYWHEDKGYAVLGTATHMYKEDVVDGDGRFFVMEKQLPDFPKSESFLIPQARRLGQRPSYVEDVPKEFWPPNEQ